ncbi:MAG: DUF488 family protein [Solirubrobacterales bacterium]
MADLTEQVFGKRLSISEAWDLVQAAEIDAESASESSPVWVASVGYERHKDNREFARMLADARVERLVDVRELPISRRRGYAKTALGEAVAEFGIEYVHMKALGNPKPLRDLYKSGRVEDGEEGYREFLLSERQDALEDLVHLLESKRTVLMCVEDDAATCHRSVIINALRARLGQLEVVDIS